MKIRNGFVSNSSSSSFVVCLPKGFSLDVIDKEKFDTVMESYDLTKKDVVGDFKKFIEYGCIEESGNYELFSVLSALLSDYCVAQFEVPSGVGELQVLDMERVNQVLDGVVKKKEDRIIELLIEVENEIEGLSDEEFKKEYNEGIEYMEKYMPERKGKSFKFKLDKEEKDEGIV